MHSSQLLLGSSAFIAFVVGAASVASDTTGLGSDVLSETEFTYPSVYIVPNTGTFMYAKTTAPQAWTTPPCTTTEKTATMTPSCPPPPFANRVETTSAGPSTTALTGAALPLRVPRAFEDLAKLLGLKREVKRTTHSAIPLHFEARSLPTGVVFSQQIGEASLASGDAEPNPVREYAFGLGIGNYERQVSDSIAAIMAGGQAGLTSMWANYVKDGNPYGLYYLANGKGDPKLAQINEGLAQNSAVSAVGGAASTVTGAAVGLAVGGVGSADKVLGAPTGTFVSNAGLAVLSIMGQVYNTNYVNLPVTSALAAGTATSTPASSVASPTTSSGVIGKSSSATKSAPSSLSQTSTASASASSSASAATKTTALSVAKLSTASVASATTAISSAKPLVAVAGVQI